MAAVDYSLVVGVAMDGLQPHLDRDRSVLVKEIMQAASQGQTMLCVTSWYRRSFIESFPRGSRTELVVDV
jgi:hypothetical protein